MTKRIFGFFIQAESNYSTPRVVARVVYKDADGTLLNLSTANRWEEGAEFADFEVHAYKGQREGEARLWGASHSYSATHITLDQAERMTKLLRKLNKGMDKLNSEEGYVRDDFAAYLIRVARILGIKEFYVRNSPRQREMSGEYQRKVDGATLQFWLQDDENLVVAR